VGDGSKVRFWNDLWCGDKVLNEAFPNLYDIFFAKDASVVVHLKFSSRSN
jgi:hypothetical protein